MEVFDCSAEPVWAGRGPVPRAAAKAEDRWPEREGFEVRGSRFEGCGVVVGLGVEAVRVAPVSMMERRAWRTSSRAVASCRMAGPRAVLRVARTDAGALARIASTSGPKWTRSAPTP